MPFPIIYPQAAGNGRLVEICSFRRSGLTDDEFLGYFDTTMKAIGDFPISRKAFLGKQVEDPQIAVLMVDWISAPEKDEFEPGERYQSLKPGFAKLIDEKNPSFLCHHLILPGTKTTSTSSFYTVSYMKIPADKQDEAAAAIEAYLASPGVGDGLDSVCFAASREDPDMIVCLSGHLNAEIVEEMRKSQSHLDLDGKLGKLVQDVSKTGFVPVKTWEF